jgi:hypothetical protein
MGGRCRVSSSCGSLFAVATCREAVLDAFRRLEARAGRRDFDLGTIVAEVMSAASYKESTVRTHVASVMCRGTPHHHAIVYEDLERVGRGRYQRV